MDMQTPQLQAIVERLEKVEGQSRALAQQNRRLKIAGAVALVLLGALVLNCGARKASDDASDEAHVIKARGIVLVDKDGRKRAELGMEDDSFTYLDLYDVETGKERASLWFLTGEHSHLGLFTDMTPRVLLDDTPSLELADQNGNKRAALFLNKDGSPTLAFYDENGKVIWRAPPPAE